MEKNSLIIVKWNSLLLAIASIISSVILLYFTHKFFIPSLLLIAGISKLIGILSNSNRLRLVGIMGLNVGWGLLGSWFFFSKQFGCIYAGLFSLIILGFGVGVSIQERFHEH